MNHARTIATATALLLTAACADTDTLGPESDADPADQSADDPTDDDAPDEAEDLGPEDGDDDREDGGSSDEQFLVDFDEAVVWEEDGIRLSVTGLGITDATAEISADFTDLLEDTTGTVLALEMTASNDHGDTVAFFVDQGQIQVGREQVDASMFLSDPVGGGEMRDGTDNSGRVIWELDAAYDEVLDEGTLDLIISGPSDAESFERIVEGDVELGVTWDAS